MQARRFFWVSDLNCVALVVVDKKKADGYAKVDRPDSLLNQLTIVEKFI